MSVASAAPSSSPAASFRRFTFTILAFCFSSLNLLMVVPPVGGCLVVPSAHLRQVVAAAALAAVRPLLLGVVLALPAADLGQGSPGLGWRVVGDLGADLLRHAAPAL